VSYLSGVTEIYATRYLDPSSKRTKNALSRLPSWIEGVLLLRGGEGKGREEMLKTDITDQL